MGVQTVKQIVLDWLFKHRYREGYYLVCPNAFYVHVYSDLTRDAVEYLEMNVQPGLWRRGGALAESLFGQSLLFSRKEELAMFMLSFCGETRDHKDRVKRIGPYIWNSANRLIMNVRAVKQIIDDWLFKHRYRNGYYLVCPAAFYGFAHGYVYRGLRQEAIDYLAMNVQPGLWRRGGAMAETVAGQSLVFSRKDDLAMFILAFGGTTSTMTIGYWFAISRD